MIEQDPGRKSRGLSKLGLTGIITASMVLMSCLVSWFLFFAGPPVNAGTAKTTARGTDMTTTKGSVVTTAELAETSAADPIDRSVYDATEKPLFEDFIWYTDDIYENGRPDQAIQLDFSELHGNWKALLWYDPQNMMDAEGWDSLLIGIHGSPDAVMLKLDWQDSYIKSIDSIVDMSAIADIEMMGVYDISGIKAGDSGYELLLTDFYLLGDYQYAFGYRLLCPLPLFKRKVLGYASMWKIVVLNIRILIQRNTFVFLLLLIDHRFNNIITIFYLEAHT